MKIKIKSLLEWFTRGTQRGPLNPALADRLAFYELDDENKLECLVVVFETIELNHLRVFPVPTVAFVFLL
jgi:hypothetical protein